MANINTKHIIAVTLSIDQSDMIREGVEYGYIRREYGKAVKTAGAEPIFVDSSIDADTVALLVSGVVISGGNDINPKFYGEEAVYCNELEPIERTQWERDLIDACDRHNVPILGVCYGNQLLNVHYGGTLHQDLVQQQHTNISHGSSSGSVMEAVTFSDDFLGFKHSERVVSAHRHHQAINRVAPGFEAIATADDGTVEAVRGHGHFGVQWHAESDGTAATIYAAFVEHCAAVAREQSTLEQVFDSTETESILAAVDFA